MITLFREFTKTLAFKVVLGLLVLSFAVFGTRDLFSPVLNDTVIKAGSRQVSVYRFKTLFDRQKQNAEQQNGGQAISTEDAVKANFDGQMLNAMAQDEALQSMLISAGIKPSPKLVVEQIQKIPGVINAVTQKFEKASYLQLLDTNHINQSDFETGLADQIRQTHYESALSAGYRTPAIMTAIFATYATQQRNLDLIAIDPTGLTPPAPPSDAELQTFYNRIKPRLKQPEMRQFSLVRFAASDFEAKIPVDEAAVQKLYEFKRDTLVKPEARTFIEITAPSQSDAQAIADGLKAGQDPNLLAKNHKGEIITFTDKPKVAVPDTAVADAAFALKEGQISNPMKTNAGFGVIRMGPITAGAVTPLSSVHEELASEYRHRKALEKINQLSNQFDTERKSGADIITVAKKLGLPIQALPPMTAEGMTRLANGQPFNIVQQNPAYAKVVKTAFDLTAGGESEVEEIGNGEYYAVKLDAVKPSQIPSLDSLKADLAKAYMQDKYAEALQARAKSVSDALTKGQSSALVAAANHGHVLNINGLDRQNAMLRLMGAFNKNQQLANEVGQRALAMRKGETFMLPMGPAQIMIGVVTAINSAPANDVTKMLPMVRAGTSRSFSQDLSAMAPIAARISVKPRIYQTTARKALGVSAELINPDPTKSAPKKDLAGQ